MAKNLDEHRLGSNTYSDVYAQKESLSFLSADYLSKFLMPNREVFH
jgi:hypothetical protein